MDIKFYETVKGYKLEEKLTVNGGTDVFILKHLQSGATIIHYAADDNDKSFYVGFKTLPQDDTGVAHILEHSVFQGSEKYKCEDLFKEILKASSATCVNAGTAADNTRFYFSTVIMSDYLKLMDIYLDAVLHPVCITDEAIFRQEGWRFEKKNDELSVNGVVFNEMSGVINSKALAELEMKRKLFHGSTYQYYSGGNPENIMELTFKDFVDFHKHYYCPENMLVVLYGNIDIEAVLYHINSVVFKDYVGCEHNKVKIAAPQLLKGQQTYTWNYEVFEDKDLKEGRDIKFIQTLPWNKFLAWSFLVIINELIGGISNEFVKLLRKKGLCKSVEIAFTELHKTFVLKVCFQGCAAGVENTLIEELQLYAKKVLDKGLDKQAIQNNLLSWELFSQYANKPGSAFSYANIISAKLFDGWINNSWEIVDNNGICKKLVENLDSDYFEKIIEKCFVAPENFVLVTYEPVLVEKNSIKGRVEQKIKAIQETISIEAIQEAAAKKKNNNSLHVDFANKEELKSMKVVEDYPYTTFEEDAKGNMCYAYNLKNDNICFMNIYSKKLALTEEDLFYFKIGRELLNIAANTSKLSCEELRLRKKTFSDFYNWLPKAYENKNEGSVIKYGLLLNMFISPSKISGGMELLATIIRDFQFSEMDTVKQTLEDLLLSKKYMTKYSAVANEISQRIDPNYKIFNLNVKDIARVQEIVDNFDAVGNEFVNRTKNLLKKFWGSTENTAFFSVNAQYVAETKQAVQKYFAALEDYDPYEECNNYVVKSQRTGYTDEESNVVFIGMNAGWSEIGYKHTGALHVLCKILSSEYMYSLIRVKNGAYSAEACVDDCGVHFFVGRTPQLKETIDLIKAIPQWLENQNFTQDQIDKYIIASARNFLRPLPLQGISIMIYNDMLGQDTFANKNKLYHEILSVTPDQLKACIPIIAKAISSLSYCVIGPKAILESNMEMFDSIAKYN